MRKISTVNTGFFLGNLKVVDYWEGIDQYLMPISDRPNLLI